MTGWWLLCPACVLTLLAGFCRTACASPRLSLWSEHDDYSRRHVVVIGREAAGPPKCTQCCLVPIGQPAAMQQNDAVYRSVRAQADVVLRAGVAYHLVGVGKDDIWTDLCRDLCGPTLEVCRSQMDCRRRRGNRDRRRLHRLRWIGATRRQHAAGENRPETRESVHCGTYFLNRNSLPDSAAGAN